MEKSSSSSTSAEEIDESWLATSSEKIVFIDSSIGGSLSADAVSGFGAPPDGTSDAPKSDFKISSKSGFDESIHSSTSAAPRAAALDSASTANENAELNFRAPSAERRKSSTFSQTAA